MRSPAFFGFRRLRAARACRIPACARDSRRGRRTPDVLQRSCCRPHSRGADDPQRSLLRSAPRSLRGCSCQSVRPSGRSRRGRSNFRSIALSTSRSLARAVEFRTVAAIELRSLVGTADQPVGTIAPGTIARAGRLARDPHAHAKTADARHCCDRRAVVDAACRNRGREGRSARSPPSRFCHGLELPRGGRSPKSLRGPRSRSRRAKTSCRRRIFAPAGRHPCGTVATRRYGRFSPIAFAGVSPSRESSSRRTCVSGRVSSRSRGRSRGPQGRSSRIPRGGRSSRLKFGRSPRGVYGRFSPPRSSRGLIRTLVAVAPRDGRLVIRPIAAGRSARLKRGVSSPPRAARRRTSSPRGGRGASRSPRGGRSPSRLPA